MKHIIFLSLLVYFVSCRSSDKIVPLQLAGCNDPEHTRSTEIKDVETFVIAKTYTRVDGSSFTDYYLNQPDAVNPNIPWVACNFPEVYKKDKLAVRINGYRLTSPANQNSIGDPIELTMIEVSTKTN